MACGPHMVRHLVHWHCWDWIIHKRPPPQVRVDIQNTGLQQNLKQLAVLAVMLAMVLRLKEIRLKSSAARLLNLPSAIACPMAASIRAG